MLLVTQPLIDIRLSTVLLHDEYRYWVKKMYMLYNLNPIFFLIYIFINNVTRVNK